jgi:hypothetical protein
MRALSPAGNVGAAADVRTDGEEHRVEVAEGGDVVGDGAAGFEGDAEVEDALDLGVEDVVGQAVGGDAVAHHAAGHIAGVADGDRVAE